MTVTVYWWQYAQWSRSALLLTVIIQWARLALELKVHTPLVLWKGIDNIENTWYSFGHLGSGEICHCRHYRQQCKIFPSNVNFSRNNIFFRINSKEISISLINVCFPHKSISNQTSKITDIECIHSCFITVESTVFNVELTCQTFSSKDDLPRRWRHVSTRWLLANKSELKSTFETETRIWFDFSMNSIVFESTLAHVSPSNPV